MPPVCGRGERFDLWKGVTVSGFRKTVAWIAVVGAVTLGGGCSSNAATRGLSQGVSRGFETVIRSIVEDTLNGFLNQP